MGSKSRESRGWSESRGAVPRMYRRRADIIFKDCKRYRCFGITQFK